MTHIQHIYEELDVLLIETEDACRDITSNPEIRYDPTSVAHLAVLRDVVVTVAHLCDLLEGHRRTLEQYVPSPVS